MSTAKFEEVSLEDLVIACGGHRKSAAHAPKASKEQKWQDAGEINYTYDNLQYSGGYDADPPKADLSTTGHAGNGGWADAGKIERGGGYSDDNQLYSGAVGDNDYDM